MGIPGIWDHMSRYGEVVDVETLRNKTITIDGHIWLYESIRGSTPHGKAPSYIVTFFKRCMALLENEIEPIVVFDGLTNDFSGGNIPNRLCKRSKRAGGKGWNMTAFTDLTYKVNAVKTLLNNMGIRVVASKEDGEAQCAQLEMAGLSHGCLTQDFDYFLYGGSNLYKVDFSRVKPIITHFSMDRICEAEQGTDFRILNRHRLISLAMLLGNDYFEKGVEKVGFVGGLEIISEFSINEDDHPSTILDRFRSYSTREIPERRTDSETKVKLRTKFFVDAFPDGFPNSDDFLSCVNVFMVPEVFRYGSNECKLPERPTFNRARVQDVMERSAGWDAERFEKEVGKSDKRGVGNKNNAAQTKITEFFDGRKRNSKSKGRVDCTNGSGGVVNGNGLPRSRREWAALTKLRKSHLEYSDMPVASQNVLLTPPETPNPQTSQKRKRGATANNENDAATPPGPSTSKRRRPARVVAPDSSVEIIDEED